MNQTIAAGSLILVTGANGFVGRAVMTALQKAGYRVRTLVRHTSGVKGIEEVCGDINDAHAVERAVSGVQGVIHLAARKSDERDSQVVNEGGTRLLAECCKNNSVRRIVNVSTQSVRLRKLGTYGRTKLAAEKILGESALTVITLRPSVVYDDAGGGIFSTILSFVQLPIVPMIGDGMVHIRPIHKNDLALIIVQALSRGSEDVLYDVGGPDSVSLMELTRELQRRLGKQKHIIKIPRAMAIAIARLTAWMPKPPVTISNVLGATEDLTMDIDPMLRDFGITPRGLTTGLDTILDTMEEAQQHREAAAVLRYAFSAFGDWHPSAGEVDRYRLALTVYGIEHHRLDASLIRHRWLLGACDAVASSTSILRKKILIASAIGECSPSTANFTLPKNTTVLTIVIVSAYMTLRAVAKKTIGLLLILFSPSLIRRNAGR